MWRTASVRWSGSQEAAAFNENPYRATVNGFGTLDVAAGAASLSVKTLRPGQEDFDDSEFGHGTVLSIFGTRTVRSVFVRDPQQRLAQPFAGHRQR